MAKLEGTKIAVLATHGFEESELIKPVDTLKNHGATVKIVSPEKKIKSWRMKNWGDEYDADLLVDEANPEDFDALLLPGGVLNPDLLRNNKQAVNFARHFADNRKPVAAICHGPWMLTEIGLAKDKNLTSYYSIQTDLKNAGGIWHDKEVVVDGLLITSRKPDDIPAFTAKFIEVLEKERITVPS